MISTLNIIDTTRKPRPGEVDGKDYHFVEKENMIKEVEAGKFIESATFSGNMYGTLGINSNMYSKADQSYVQVHPSRQ